MKKALTLVPILMLATFVLAACGGAEPIDQDAAVQTAVAETLQVQNAIQLGVDATLEAQGGSDAQPDEAPQDAQPAGQADASGEIAPNVEFDGIEFYLNNQLFPSWTAEITAPPDPASDNPFQAPSYYQFDFQSAAYDPEELRLARLPRLYVLPVSNMQSFLDQGYGLEALARLQGILADQPDSIPDPMPVLPYILNFDSSEVLHTNLEYVDFQNGSGVRFLASYSQAPFPVQGLSYYFQGLTNDGAYYVSLTIPVEESVLVDLNAPYTNLADEAAYNAFIDNFLNYLEDAKSLLNAAPNSSFSPDLTIFDAMVQSLNINR